MTGRSGAEERRMLNRRLIVASTGLAVAASAGTVALVVTETAAAQATATASDPAQSATTDQQLQPPSTATGSTATGSTGTGGSTPFGGQQSHATSGGSS